MSSTKDKSWVADVHRGGRIEAVGLVGHGKKPRFSSENDGNPWRALVKNVI